MELLPGSLSVDSALIDMLTRLFSLFLSPCPELPGTTSITSNLSEDSTDSTPWRGNWGLEMHKWGCHNQVYLAMLWPCFFRPNFWKIKGVWTKKGISALMKQVPKIQFLHLVAQFGRSASLPHPAAPWPKPLPLPMIGRYPDWQRTLSLSWLESLGQTADIEYPCCRGTQYLFYNFAHYSWKSQWKLKGSNIPRVREVLSTSLDVSFQIGDIY